MSRVTSKLIFSLFISFLLLGFVGCTDTSGQISGGEGLQTAVVPAISISDVSVTEGDGTATFTVSLSNSYSQDITVDLASADGTATAGSDYTAVSTTLTIPAGSTSVTGTVAITDDGTNCETDETLNLVLSNPSLGTLADATGTATIHDNDLPTLSVNDVAVVEGVTAAFTVTKSGTPACAEDITFSWRTQAVDTNSGDYTAVSATTVTIPAASSNATLSVSTLVNGDTSSETFKVVISSPTRALIADSEGVGTIAAPALNLDLTSSLPAAVSFSRASTATYFDSDRVLKTGAVNNARFDHDPTTGRPLGLLLEEARTNLFTYSQDLGDAAWNKGLLTATSNAAPAPDGTTTATRVVETAVNGVHYVDRYIGSQNLNTVWTLSAFVKADGRSMIKMVLSEDSSGGEILARFDLGTKTIMESLASGSAQITNSDIQELPNGWFRIWLSGVPKSSAATGGLTPSLVYLTSIYGDTYIGNTSSGFLIWGLQLEQGAFPTSYIPTGAATVTRAADSAAVLSTSWYNASGGVLTSDLSLHGNDTNGFLPHLVNAASGWQDSIGFQMLNNGSADGFAGSTAESGVDQAKIIDTTNAQLRTEKRLALRFRANDFQFVLDGVSKGTDTNGTLPSNIDQLVFAQESYQLEQLDSTLQLKSLKYYVAPLNSASLLSLTQPDARPTLYIEDATATEGGNLTFTVKLSQALSPAAALTVNWTASSGTATLGTDTSGASSGTVTIASGGTSATVTIPTTSDGLVEGDETLTVTLTGLPATVISGDLSATGTIQDGP